MLCLDHPTLASPYSFDSYHVNRTEPIQQNQKNLAKRTKETKELPLLLVVVLLCLAQIATKGVRIKRKQPRKKTRSFPTQGKEGGKSEKMESQEPSKRFIILNDDRFKWVLPHDLAKYANSHFNQYVKEQDLKESILTENLVSANITEVKKLDEFMSHLLKENNQTSVCPLDTILDKIQRKSNDIMGPLSKVWHALESAATAPDHEADLIIEGLLNLVQQTVFLVRPTNNTISYHRRLSALAGAMKSSSRAKSMIKDESALLENSGKELSDKDFRVQITDTVKAQ